MAKGRYKDLDALFENQHYDLDPWIIGFRPKWYKRLSCSSEEAMRLAKLGASRLAAAYGVRLFFTQAVIAGAILSDEYDEIIICLSSQYGKSWLMGHVALLRAYEGAKQYIAAASADKTQIIMAYTTASTQEASQEIKQKLLMKPTELERLTTSVSKQKLAFADGGFVEPITLADAYNDNVAQNKAVGRGGDFIVDEAALVSEDTFAEMGRREFAKIDGTKYKSVLISNPHRPGTFYDKLTQEEVPEKTIIVWADALTGVEEGRWPSKEYVYNSDFAKNKSARRRYLLSVLDVDGGGMFDVPKVHPERIEEPETQHFLGIDAAYKGKDAICVADIAVDEHGIRCEEIYKMNKPEWIEGVTSRDIISDIVRIDRKLHVANVCVDTGYGVWLNEGLIQAHVNSHGVNFSEAPTRARVKARHYAAVNASNKRAEMHLDLQDLIENGRISFSEEAYEQIKPVLPYITCERTANGKIKIVEKSKVKAIIGKSPDELDAVLLGIQAMVQYLGDDVEPIT